MTGYPGPPPTTPLADWRPGFREQHPLPRQLPELDSAAVDRAERTATRITLAVGVVAAATVLLITVVQLG